MPAHFRNKQRPNPSKKLTDTYADKPEGLFRCRQIPNRVGRTARRGPTAGEAGQRRTISATAENGVKLRNDFCSRELRQAIVALVEYDHTSAAMRRPTT